MKTNAAQPQSSGGSRKVDLIERYSRMKLPETGVQEKEGRVSKQCPTCRRFRALWHSRRNPAYSDGYCSRLGSVHDQCSAPHPIPPPLRATVTDIVVRGFDPEWSYTGAGGSKIGNMLLCAPKPI